MSSMTFQQFDCETTFLMFIDYSTVLNDFSTLFTIFLLYIHC